MTFRVQTGVQRSRGRSQPKKKKKRKKRAQPYLLFDLLLHRFESSEDFLGLHAACDDKTQVLWSIELMVVAAYLQTTQINMSNNKDPYITHMDQKQNVLDLTCSVLSKGSNECIPIASFFFSNSENLQKILMSKYLSRLKSSPSHMQTSTSSGKKACVLSQEVNLLAQGSHFLLVRVQNYLTAGKVCTFYSEYLDSTGGSEEGRTHNTP